MPAKDIVVSVAPRKTPLRLMAERLEPFVRYGLLDLSEVLDMLMGVAMARGFCPTADKINAAQNFLIRILTRQAPPAS